MAQTINNKYIDEGHEVYAIKNLDLPNSYELLLQELDIPNSWANGAKYFTNDSDFVNKYTLSENAIGVGLLSKAIQDDENLLKLIFDIIGYGKKKIYGYSNQRMNDIDQTEEEYHESNGIVDIFNRTKINPTPSNYEYNTKKRNYGYNFTGGKQKRTSTEEIKNHKIKQFITPSWVASKHDKDNPDLDEDEWDFIYNPLGDTSTKYWKFSSICSPIIDELRTFSSPYNLRSMCELTSGLEKRGSLNNIKTLVNRRKFIYDSVTLRNDYASNKENINSKELLINSPLMNIGFFENMKSMPINTREWSRWINRGIGNLNQLIMPQLSLPKNKPFILITYSTSIWQPWEGIAEIDIYLIFNQISFNDYNLKVNKSIPKDEWYKQHLFNRGRKGGFNIKNKNQDKLYLDDNIYLGYHINIGMEDVTTTNFFGPIEMSIHPKRCREVMSEWDDEDNEFPVDELFYKYKIIELNDMYKKIVNWPRNKPVKM